MYISLPLSNPASLPPLLIYRNVALLKDLTDLLPNYVCWEVQNHINTRLHKDMLPVVTQLVLSSSW